MSGSVNVLQDLLVSCVKEQSVMPTHVFMVELVWENQRNSGHYEYIGSHFIIQLPLYNSAAIMKNCATILKKLADILNIIVGISVNFII